MKDECGGEWVAQRLARWRESREPEALGDLLKWQRNRAYAIALRILERGADAEDAVQQAFIKMLTRTHGFTDADDFKVAVYRAVVQCALNLLQSQRSRGNAEKVMSYGRHNLPDAPQSPAGIAENAEALQMVRSELNEMNPEDRALVVLCCQEGLSVSAASEVLSVKRETVRDRLARALSELRARLNKRGVSLSLLLLIGMLQKDGAVSAPASLCAALDKALPGSSCTSIAGESATQQTAAKILAEAGLKSGVLTGTVVALTLAAALTVCVTTTIYVAPTNPSMTTPSIKEGERTHGSAGPVADGSTNNVTPSQGISSPGGPVELHEKFNPMPVLDAAPGAKTDEQLKEEAKMRNTFKGLVAAGAMAAAMNGWAGDANPTNPGPGAPQAGGSMVGQGNGVYSAPAKPDADAAAIKAAAKKAAAQSAVNTRRESGER